VAGFQVHALSRVGVVALVTGHPTGGEPAFRARMTIPAASAGLVTNSISAGTPTWWRRDGPGSGSGLREKEHAIDQCAISVT
jgi:hypothetical protein